MVGFTIRWLALWASAMSVGGDRRHHRPIARPVRHAGEGAIRPGGSGRPSYPVPEPLYRLHHVAARLLVRAASRHAQSEHPPRRRSPPGTPPLRARGGRRRLPAARASADVAGTCDGHAIPGLPAQPATVRHHLDSVARMDLLPCELGPRCTTPAGPPAARRLQCPVRVQGRARLAERTGSMVVVLVAEPRAVRPAAGPGLLWLSAPSPTLLQAAARI